MLTKQEHIAYWKTTASKDWKAVHQLFEGGSYIHSLFWAHLVLEKLLKAHWIKDNIDNFPPRIHNLISLLHRTTLKLNANDIVFLDTMNDFQIEGRYPDYIKNIYKIYKRKETLLILKKVEKLRTCLLNNLP